MEGRPVRREFPPLRLPVAATTLFLLSAPLALLAAEPVKIAMTPDKWTTDGEVAFESHNGFDAIVLKPGSAQMKLKTGSAVLNGLVFHNGTIEYDVDPIGSMGAAIGFRRRDQDTYEEFYLRPRPKCEEAWDCLRRPFEACCPILFCSTCRCPNSMDWR